jgi:hypothetical protein
MEVDHPDFEVIRNLIEVHLERQKALDNGEDYEKILGGRIDTESLFAAAMVRASTVSKTNPSLMMTLAAMWLEAFVVGLDFSELPRGEEK